MTWRCPAASPIDWLIRQQNTNSSWLVTSYEGDVLHREYTYDQALAIIAFTDAGLLTQATNLLRAMADRQLTDSNVVGAWCEYYTNGVPETWKYVTGPIAWMVMAINFYEVRTGDTNYAGTAERALTFLRSLRDEDTNSATFGAFRWSPWTNEWSIFSTEHNLDVYSAYRYRGLLGGNDSNLTVAAGVLQYLRKWMWAPSNSIGGIQSEPLFWGGWNAWLINDCGDVGRWSVTTDAQAWGILALGPVGPGGEEFYRAAEWITTNRFVWGMTTCTQDFSPTITGVAGYKCRPCVGTDT